MFSHRKFWPAVILGIFMLTANGCGVGSRERGGAAGNGKTGPPADNARPGQGELVQPPDSGGVGAERKEPLGMSFDQIKEVMDRHAPDLMKIDGVVGVAIGARADSSLCIQVLVRKPPGEMEPVVPKSIEGVPVVIIETGEIRPLGGR